MRDPLSDLSETLLRAGISPTQVDRYLGELRDHAEDIAEQLQTTGLPAEAAEHAARMRLGNTDALALPMLLEPRFRSRASRLPVLFYLALPLLSQLLASALLVVGLNIAATRLGAHSALPDLGSAVSITWLILPVMLAWLVLSAATRRRARLRYCLLSIVMGTALAASLQLEILLPTAGRAGAIAVSLATPALLPLMVLLTLALLPLAFHNRRTAWL